MDDPKYFSHGIRNCFLQKESSFDGGVLIFVKKNLLFKILKDLSESDEHKEILSLAISNKNFSNIFLSCCYKPSKDDNDILSTFLKQVFKKSTVEKLSYCRSQHKLLRIF